MDTKESVTDKLLLAFARHPEINQASPDIINPSQKNINWQRFISKANLLGLAPACYLSIKKQNLAIPPEILNTLHTLYNLNLSHSMKLYAKLIKILSSFTRAKIDIIPLKGPILSDTLYNRIGYRKYSDLDILIRKQDFPWVKKHCPRLVISLLNSPILKNLSSNISDTAPF